jgi:hypothetical protein
MNPQPPSKRQPPPPSVKSVLEEMNRADALKRAHPPKPAKSFRSTKWWKIGVGVVVAAMFVPLVMDFMPEEPLGPQFEGFFEGSDRVAFWGWAWDAAHPKERVSVEIDDGVHPKAIVVADRFREDLKYDGRGDGKHAFYYMIPKSQRDGRQYTVHIRVANSTRELDDSPKIITYAKSKTTKVR